MLEYDADDITEEDLASLRVTHAYLESLAKTTDMGKAERRRAWATHLYIATSGFPQGQTEIQKIDALTRYLEGGFTGPRDADQ